MEEKLIYGVQGRLDHSTLFFLLANTRTDRYSHALTWYISNLHVHLYIYMYATGPLRALAGLSVQIKGPRNMLKSCGHTLSLSRSLSLSLSLSLYRLQRTVETAQPPPPGSPQPLRPCQEDERCPLRPAAAAQLQGQGQAGIVSGKREGERERGEKERERERGPSMGSFGTLLLYTRRHCKENLAHLYVPREIDSSRRRTSVIHMLRGFFLCCLSASPGWGGGGGSR